MIAAREGIAFGERSDVLGSENRIVAMISGQIKAAIVDLANKDLLMAKVDDRLHVLPGIDDPVSDEVLFANLDWLESHQETVDIVLEELLGLWRDMTESPAVIEQECAKYGLLEDLPQELLSDVAPYDTEGVEVGLWAPDGGTTEIATRDIAFYPAADQLEGAPETLKVEDFWYLAPLKPANAKVGG